VIRSDNHVRICCSSKSHEDDEAHLLWHRALLRWVVGLKVQAWEDQPEVGEADDHFDLVPAFSGPLRPTTFVSSILLFCCFICIGNEEQLADGQDGASFSDGDRTLGTDVVGFEA
jgi:hypothetical protein